MAAADKSNTEDDLPAVKIGTYQKERSNKEKVSNE